jgi:hypothetical protein
VLPFDLHVLGMPPAFNLSQDQTLFSWVFFINFSHSDFLPVTTMREQYSTKAV